MSQLEETALEECARVLEALGAEDQADFLQGASCRRIRKALVPIMKRMHGRIYGGKTREEYEDQKFKRKETKRREHMRVQQDREMINKRALREQRLRKLELLQTVQNSIPMIPDGVADDLAGDTMDRIEETENDHRLYNYRSCYTCKCRFDKLHFFYDQLCPSCAELNYLKRTQTADLTGKYALVTGGRVKIGFQVVLKLLRAGAFVIVTSRFPKDAALRFAKEADFEQWKDRIRIFGLDFRNIKLVEEFCSHLNTLLPHLDIVINNACQTIRRPASYYSSLVEYEASNHLVEWSKEADKTVVPHLEALSTALTTQTPILPEDAEEMPDVFPQNAVDVNNQQIDLRKTNSWLLKLEDVSSGELAEVFAINSIAPFVMNSKLKPAMERSPSKEKFIVNVSAMEGKFYRYKGPEHPHTNMAKAALNMMTRTSSADYAKSGIYMTSVDTGWINDENPVERAKRTAEAHNFQTPIDEIDAAARILDPVFGTPRTATGEPLHGCFLKDYRATEW